MKLIGWQHLSQVGEHVSIGCRVLNRSEILVGQLERLHREPTPGVVGDPASADRVGQLVARDRQKPGDRHHREFAVDVVNCEKRLRERLAHQIRGQFGACNAHPQKPEHIPTAYSVERAERFGISFASAPQQITIVDVHTDAHGF